MLLTITTTFSPATELGYLLNKHQDRPQSLAVSAGQAHVFYPEATPGRCKAALLLDKDPITLVRAGPAGRSRRQRARGTRQRDHRRRERTHDENEPANRLAVQRHEAVLAVLRERGRTCGTSAWATASPQSKPEPLPRRART